jgi:hypothetical protein
MKKVIPLLAVLLPLASLGQAKPKDSASYCFETWCPEPYSPGDSTK